jgi:hypothetical protein
MSRTRAEIEKEIAETQKNINFYSSMVRRDGANTPQGYMSVLVLQSFETKIEPLKQELSRAIEEEKQYKEQERREREFKEAEAKKKRMEKERKIELERIAGAVQLIQESRIREEKLEQEHSKKFKESSDKEFSIDFLRELLKSLEKFSKFCEEVEANAEKNLQDMISNQENNEALIRNRQKNDISSFVSSKRTTLSQYESKLQELNNSEENRQNGLYNKITQCKSILGMIKFAVKKFARQNLSYDASGDSYPKTEAENVTLEYILKNSSEVQSIIKSFTEADISSGKNNKPSKGFTEKCMHLYNYSSQAKKLLKDEIKHIRADIFANKDSVKQERDRIWNEYQSQCIQILQNRKTQQQANNKTRSLEAEKQSADLEKYKSELQLVTIEKIDSEIHKFTADFDPEQIGDKYAEIYGTDPLVVDYKCIKSDNHPKSIRMATLTYDLSPLNLGKYAKMLLETHYPMFYRNKKLTMPYYINISKTNGICFLQTNDNRSSVYKTIQSFILKLLLKIQPGLLKLTLYDGEGSGKNLIGL